MKIYGITIRPASAFGTPLKGDTIFGHFCCQAAEDRSLLHNGLDHWIERYAEAPFAVFSSAWPVFERDDGIRIAVTRPVGLVAAPAAGLAENNRCDRIKKNKADKKRKWLLLDVSLKVKICDELLKSDSELFELFLESREGADVTSLRLLGKEHRRICTTVSQPHNSINRLVSSTAGGEFAPFSHDNLQYLPGLSLIIFVAVNEEALGVEQLQRGFERIGAWGYGRDASAGLGRFTVESVKEFVWPKAEDTASGCWTLGPSVPQKNTFLRCHATPFTRFGKHGPSLAVSGNPFKNPVVMADDGAVLYPADRALFGTPYLGTAVTGVSAVDKRTVAQGYSLYLPC
jgi:CRISPR-associated protein Csm4